MLAVAGEKGAERVKEEQSKASRFARNRLIGNSTSLAFLEES
jgi:hypothetical protein